MIQIRIVMQSKKQDSTYPYYLHPNECNQELCCYSFAISLDRCAGSSNTCDDLTSRVCAPKINESIKLTKSNQQNMYHANVKVSLMIENVT